MKAPLNVGLIGLGRIGQIFARDLAHWVEGARLTAVADVDAAVAESAAREHDVARWYAAPAGLLDDAAVDAVVIASPTATHCDLTLGAVSRGKPVFCEKPPALSLAEAQAMKRAVDDAGVYFQLGFMRRFDTGYAAAHRQMRADAIGVPVLFKSTSRDPYRPSLQYAEPKTSGGLIMDMGIHDLDLALWFMGPVRTVHAVGGVLSYPEFAELGDIDTAVITLTFASGALGVIDLARRGVYGYDISTELLGPKGALRIGYLRETPVVWLTENAVTHDTVPYFPERFGAAYLAELQRFVVSVQSGQASPVTVDDGVAAIQVALAAGEAYRTQQSVDVTSVAE